MYAIRASVSRSMDAAGSFGAYAGRSESSSGSAAFPPDEKSDFLLSDAIVRVVWWFRQRVGNLERDNEVSALKQVIFIAYGLGYGYILVSRRSVSLIPLNSNLSSGADPCCGCAAWGR